jgi:hypothetical protein
MITSISKLIIVTITRSIMIEDMIKKLQKLKVLYNSSSGFYIFSGGALLHYFIIYKNKKISTH